MTREPTYNELLDKVAALTADNAELEFLLNEGGTWEQQLSAAEATAAALRTALAKAKQFIVNGVELGYIKMPKYADDPAHETLPAILAALDEG